MANNLSAIMKKFCIKSWCHYCEMFSQFSYRGIHPRGNGIDAYPMKSRSRAVSWKAKDLGSTPDPATCISHIFLVHEYYFLAIRWPNKCRWRYSRALHAGLRLVFRKKRHRRAQHITHNFYITFISILLFLYYVYFILHFFYITWIKLNLYIKKVQFYIYS